MLFRSNDTATTEIYTSLHTLSLHDALPICRRAERRLVSLVRQNDQQVSAVLLAYLNRLGDLLFVLARAVNAQAGQTDVHRKKSR